MPVQAGLCQTCSETTLLVFPRGGSFECQEAIQEQNDKVPNNCGVIILIVFRKSRYECLSRYLTYHFQDILKGCQLGTNRFGLSILFGEVIL